MDLGLRDARVIVTGGASNIGRGIVHGFAREGSCIAICDIDNEQAERVKVEAIALGAPAVLVLPLDLTLETSGSDAIAAVVAAWGGIDALVNSAGWSQAEFFATDTDRARWQKTIEVNLFTAIGMTQAVIDPMRESGRGSIVFLSSDAAAGEIRQAIYGTTKAGLIALARTVAKEHGRHGIRSNVVSPGLVLPESDSAVGGSSLWALGRDSVFNEKQIDSLEAGIPLRRLTTAVDVANAVLWMSSETVARQVTGQVISVSGGYSMP